MQIKEIIWQNRRDFEAIYVCEHCNKEEKGEDYDDSYFHNQGIPKMKCSSCGKIASDEYVPLQTKYPDGYII